MDNKEKKDRGIAIAGTIAVHALVVLVLFLMAFRTPLPLPGEEGVEVDLGMMVYSPYRKHMTNFSRAVFRLYYQVVTRTGLEAALACIGAGVVLMLFGFFTFRKKAKNLEQRKQLEKESEEMMTVKSDKPAWYVFLGKGFALNFLNPFVWLLWFSAVAIVAGKMGGNKLSTIVFFAIILGTTFAMELLKGWGAAKLKVFLTPERTTLINRIAGVMLMLCGAYFTIFRGIVNLI